MVNEKVIALQYHIFDGQYRYKNERNGVEIVGVEDLKTTAIDIPNKIDGRPVVSIGNEAFYLCFDAGRVSIPPTVKKIGKDALACCHSLKTVDIPVNVKVIDDGAFRGSKNLRRMVIPDGVTEVAEDLFNDCRQLESVTLPDSIRK